MWGRRGGGRREGRKEGKTFEFLEVALDGSGAAGTRHGNVEFVIIGVGHFTFFFSSFFFLLFSFVGFSWRDWES